MRKQIRPFTTAMWLSIDESNPRNGIVTDTLKKFSSGEKLEMRRNHEQNTTYASFDFAGKAWGLNEKDIPTLASGALEESFARRYSE